VKFEELVAVPPGVVTVILPVVAPEGTAAVTLLSFTNVKTADVPLNRTPLTPAKWLPLIVTDVPTTPLDGEKPLIVGPVTVKFEELVAVPPGVVTVILPVVAPEGTVAVTLPSFTKANVAEIPLNRTPLTAVKWFPLIVTVVPIAPLEGEKPLIVGALLPVTVKLDPLIAITAAVVSVIFPVVAPIGTVAVTLPSFTNAKTAEVPLNRTLVAPVKWSPLTVTVAPIAPLEGEKLLMVGALLELTVKFAVLVAVPDVVVSWIFPVVAPEGTVAVTCASDWKMNVAEVPLNLTLLTPVKPLPVMMTAVPGAPVDGENPLITGFTGTTKSVALVPVPPDAITTIFPVVAPDGTVAVRCWSSATLYVVATPWNVTEDTPVPAVNPLPMTVTRVPGGPLGGVNEVMVVAAAAGTTAKVDSIAIAPSVTAAPRTRTRARILIVTSLPVQRATSDHHRGDLPRAQ
jgi:hypothetical protein